MPVTDALPSEREERLRQRVSEQLAGVAVVADAQQPRQRALRPRIASEVVQEIKLNLNASQNSVRAKKNVSLNINISSRGCFKKKARISCFFLY